MSHISVNDPATQKIGWLTALCVLVSNIIGGGIFTVTGFIARDLGAPLLILLLWFVGALFAIGGFVPQFFLLRAQSRSDRRRKRVAAKGSHLDGYE